MTPNPRSEVARFAGVGVQAAVFLVLIVWLGREGDEYFAFETPYLTAASALIGSIAVTIWLVVRLSPPKK